MKKSWREPPSGHASSPKQQSTVSSAQHKQYVHRCVVQISGPSTDVEQGMESTDVEQGMFRDSVTESPRPIDKMSLVQSVEEFGRRNLRYVARRMAQLVFHPTPKKHVAPRGWKDTHPQAARLEATKRKKSEIRQRQTQNNKRETTRRSWLQSMTARKRPTQSIELWHKSTCKHTVQYQHTERT